MNQDMLEALLRVHADGPPLHDYKAEGAIHQWMDLGHATSQATRYRQLLTRNNIDCVL
ncbi:hypothetical protein DPMN_151683 [Dreissena polymorpha]|uniref:Uncharacterized protein n=1 Tax=Dreissena polymorpha TaxID=45954 RepID=A0A9D4J775_DREPO|nr:hypothetical protein DPMN_151683 [Dreissena polymorpha]